MTKLTALPCPFCGCADTQMLHNERSSPWVRNSCDSCGAEGPEVRMDDQAENQVQAMREAVNKAFEAWNERATK